MTKELLADLRWATRAWKDKLHIDLEDIVEDWPGIRDEDEELEFSSNSTLIVSLPRCEEKVELTVGEFVEFSKEAVTIKTIPEKLDVGLEACYSKRRLLVRCEPHNEKALYATDYSIEHVFGDHNSSEIKVIYDLRAEATRILARQKEISKEQVGSNELNQLEALLEEKRLALTALGQIGTTDASKFFPLVGEHDGKKYTCSVTRGFSLFGVAVTSLGIYEKYFPPIINGELFIEVYFDEEIDDLSLAQELAEAYLFELATSHGLQFRKVPRPMLDYDDDDMISSEWFECRFRPLLRSRGSVYLMRLFNKAITTYDPEVELLSLVKVVEYVSQTVVRQQATEAIRTKLLSPRALDPDVSFIQELESLIDEQRGYKKDREAIRQTVLTCCSIVDLVPYLPDFLGSLRSITESSKAKDKEEALGKISAALYSTRNSMAHAKANYTPTGEECPPEQLRVFLGCAELIAQQVIRWFCSRPEHERVI